MVNPRNAEELIAVTFERPLPAGVHLWRGNATTLAFKHDRELLELPKVEGDNDDATLVLYYFGATQGGTAQANIDRWISQMQQPDGSDSKSKAKTESMTVNGLNVSTVDVAGVYTAEMAPGSKTFHNDADYRLRAAVVETPKGNYFVKLAGPMKTIARWDKEYNDYLKSVEFK